MEKRKVGRPKSKEPTRNRNINFRVSDSELENIIKICNENDIRYIDVFLKGLEYWSNNSNQ